MRTVIACSFAVLLVACSGGNVTVPAGQQAPATIPVTSKSPEAIQRFEKGRTLLDNLRIAEAAEELNEALKLDPNFVSAHAAHSQTGSLTEGMKELEQAAAQASSLPEAERVYIEAQLATTRGEQANATTLWQRVTTLAPGDWRAHLGQGLNYFINQKYDEAAQALRKATELNPQAGPAYNMLGYASLRQGSIDSAIQAFQRYTSVNPQEPNAQDSLGEALIAGGKFTEAEAAFRKAAELSPRFANAWEGVAYAKFYAHDPAGGREALTKAVATAERSFDKVTLETVLALAALSERKTAEAMAALDAAEKVPDAQPTATALVPMYRALALTDAGKHRDALTQVANGLQYPTSGQAPAALARNVRRQGLVIRALAETALKDTAAIEKTVAALEQEASGAPDDPLIKSSLHFGRGMLDVTKNDFKSAKTHFEACSVEDQLCQWQGIMAAGKAGDRAAADAWRDRFLRIYVRDPLHLYVRSRLSTPKSS